MKESRLGASPAAASIGTRAKLVSTIISTLALSSGLTMAGTFPAELELSTLLPVNGGDGTVGTIINGDGADFRSGNAVAAGDLNGDNVADLIIGAERASPGGDFRAGEAYVVFGDSLGLPAEFELSSLRAINGGDGTAGFVLLGIDPGDAAGMSLSDGVDVNGDGLDDLIIGADLADPGSATDGGEIYVVFGSDTGYPAEIDLASLLAINGGDGSTGFVIKA